MISKVKLITEFSTKDNITLHNTRDILKFLHDFENLDFWLRNILLLSLQILLIKL